MRRSVLVAILLASLTLCSMLGAADADFLSLQRRLGELFKENVDSIVRVKAAYKSEKEGEKPQVVIGTGFFISRDGYILTNASIAYKPDRLWVEHKNISYSARVIGEDLPANLALIQIDTKPAHFTFFQLADSPEMPESGTILLRISAPLDFEPSPAFGIVSGRESRFAQRFFPCAYIRTTIPAGPGDGGAAYLDLNGKLVGIQVGSLPDINSSYILPSRAAMRIRDDFLFSGKVTYGWIGFEVREERTVASGNQIVLSLIMPGTPAESAGMVAGDVIEEIGDYPVRTIDDLRNAMFYTRVGQYVRVRLTRDAKPIEINVRLAARPETEPLVHKVDPTDADSTKVISGPQAEASASTPLGSIINGPTATEPALSPEAVKAAEKRERNNPPEPKPIVPPEGTNKLIPPEAK
ncbi:MAG: trypsin-like peptidase domain-containing protein [Verrucomicrobiota bacterium]|nr:trypsin-like peptidase domain-containing protein [Verrucomicrobiota bacterium]